VDMSPIKHLKCKLMKNNFSQTKYKENYIKKFDDLKSLNNNHLNDLVKFNIHVNNVKNNTNSISRSPLGFSSYKVPRVHNSMDLSGIKIKLENSKFNTINMSPNHKLYNDKITKIFENKNTLEESKRINRIIESVEQMEMSNTLPKISTICSQNQMQTVSIQLRNHKVMGEKYNPLNFYHGKSKSTVRRNNHGALYEH
jgi:hypothetical protein